MSSQLGSASRLTLGIVAVLGSLVTVGLSAAVAGAAPGDPDLSFGSGGRVLTDFGAGQDGANAVAVDAAGRIVAAGGGGISDPARPGATAFAVARYLPDGSLDPSFGGDGRVQTDFGATNALIRAVEFDSQDRIVAAGSSIQFDGIGASIALARYLPDGTPDPAFGDGGEVVTQIGLSGASDATIDPQGRIVVIGASTGRGGILPTALRYLPDGSLDPAFSGDGVRRIRNGGLFSFDSVAIDATGRIALAGSSEAPRSGTDRFTVLRLLADGGNDPGFGRNGRVVLLRGTRGAAASVITGFSRGLIVGGSCSCGKRDQGQFVVARLTVSGRLARGFGEDGFAHIGFSGPAEATTMSVDGAGRVVIGGIAPGPTLRFGGTGIARLTPRGRLDRSFSGDGKLTVDAEIAAGPVGIDALALDLAGAIVTAGTGVGLADTDFAVSRYMP